MDNYFRYSDFNIDRLDIISFGEIIQDCRMLSDEEIKELTKQPYDGTGIPPDDVDFVMEVPKRALYDDRLDLWFGAFKEYIKSISRDSYQVCKVNDKFYVACTH